MSVTLTLENIPDEVFRRLEQAAKLHRRSLNGEAIVCLESVLLSTKVTPSERLARAKALRAELPSGRFKADDIDAFKARGRQ